MNNKYRKEDIDTVKKGLKLMKEICSSYTDECNGCPLKVSNPYEDGIEEQCILMYSPCDMLYEEIEKCFT